MFGKLHKFMEFSEMFERSTHKENMIGFMALGCKHCTQCRPLVVILKCLLVGTYIYQGLNKKTLIINCMYQLQMVVFCTFYGYLM